MGVVADLILDSVKRKREEEARLAEEERMAAALERAIPFAEAAARSVGQPVVGGNLSLPGDELTVNLPTARQFSEGDRLRRSAALQEAGLDEKKLYEATEQDMRNNALQDVLAKFRRGASPDASYADFINKKSIAPVDVSGGVVFDRFNTADPILGESSAVGALADYRDQQSADLRVRSDAVRDLLLDPTVPALLKADIANKGRVSKPERVKVRGEDGNDNYYDAIPLPTGGFEYRAAADTEGAPVQVSGGVTDTSEAFNIRNRARIFGINEQDALRTLIYSKSKRPKDAWPEFVRLAATSYHTNKGANKEKTQALAAQLFSLAYPGEEIPTASGATDDGYGSPEAIRDDYSAGLISREEAISALRGMGFE